MSKAAHSIEIEYNRKQGADAWSRLPQDVRDLAATVGEEMERLIKPLLLSPLPEGTRGPDPLEALVSKQVDEGLRWRGWWGVFSVKTKCGEVQFGQTRLDPNAKLRSVASDRSDWFLSPRWQPLLLPVDAQMVFRKAGDCLFVGLNLPEVEGPLVIDRTATGETVDFYLLPENTEERVIADRLLARPWSAVAAPDARPRGDALYPVLTACADSVAPLAMSAPPHRLLRNMLRLPASLFDELEQCEVGGERLFWLSLPWPESFDSSCERLLGRLRMNVVVFSDRLPAVLNGGLASEEIAQSSDIAGPHAVFIKRVYDPNDGKLYFDRREAAAVSQDTYSLRAVFDDRPAIAELAFDQPGPTSKKVVEYEYVPLEEAPRDVRPGSSIGFEHVAAVHSAELLDARQFGAPPSNEGDVWSAFTSALAYRGRCVTRREIIKLLQGLDFLQMHVLAEWDKAVFTQRVGRLKERAGVFPYTELSIPLRADHPLSPQDICDASYLLESRLHLSMGLNDCVKIKIA